MRQDDVAMLQRKEAKKQSEQRRRATSGRREGEAPAEPRFREPRDGVALVPLKHGSARMLEEHFHALATSTLGDFPHSVHSPSITVANQPK